MHRHEVFIIRKQLLAYEPVLLKSTLPWPCELQPESSLTVN